MIYKKLLELGCNNEEVVTVMNNIILNLIQYNIEFNYIEDFFCRFLNYICSRRVGRNLFKF